MSRVKESEKFHQKIFVYVFVYFIFVYVSCIYDNDIRYTKIYDSCIHDYSPNISAFQSIHLRTPRICSLSINLIRGRSHGLIGGGPTGANIRVNLQLSKT